MRSEWFPQAGEKVLEPAKTRVKNIGYSIERDAKLSMKEGKGKHSPPGSPPYTQTKALQSSISTAWSGLGDRGGRVDIVGEPSSSNPSYFTVRVGTNKKYGLYLELGTSKMRPRPWLRPAKEKARSFGVRDPGVSAPTPPYPTTVVSPQKRTRGF